MTRLFWFLSDLSSRLWLNASLYGIVAVATALLAIYLKQFIPGELSQEIGADAVDSILNILAVSMLSVTIFSLSTMVSAYGSATNNVTPRATTLLVEDKMSHRALSTFLGAFIFSIVGIVALKTGVYGSEGRLVLFVVSIGVIVMIVITLLRWIEYLTHLGRVGETIARVEEVTTEALEKRLSKPYLGGMPLLDDNDIPKNAVPITAGTVAYVQYIDMAHLSGIAEKHNARIYVTATPGKFMDENLPVAYITGKKNNTPEIVEEIRKGFITGVARSFKQDPRFGLAVLYEIGIRALPPTMNDPGTTIQIIGTAVRILSIWAKRDELAKGSEVEHPYVYMQPLRIDDLFDDFFPPISRDGAAVLEVQMRLQKAYQALARLGDKDISNAAKRHSRLSLKRAEKALVLDEDKKILRETALLK